MATAPISESDEEYHSLSPHESENAEDDEAESDMEPPVHPLPSMQAAFQESILESTEDDDTVRPGTSHDADERRKKLLEAQQYDDSWTTRWKQKTGARHHPLLKLMAQIVFGMHLLQQGQAKSDEEVVKILQQHVNEVDSFLERTSEDFDLAIADIEGRLRHLNLPMEHLEVFNSMLDDKTFRTQLLEGNDKIEKIIDRTAKAMNAALMDVRKGLKATQELGKYLDSIKGAWPRDSSGLSEVFGAMRGNEQGWMKYLKDLQAKGNNLASCLVQLGTVIGELSKLAAAASRRNAVQSRAISPSRSARSLPVPPSLRSKFAREEPDPMPTIAFALNKPLPKEPDTAAGAARLTISKMHPVPFATRYEQPRQSPQSPAPSGRRASSQPIGSPARPRTAGAPRDARSSKRNTSELANFLRDSGPLRSNPPDHAAPGEHHAKRQEARPARSQSQGANQLMNSVAGVEPSFARSKSHGAAMILTEPKKDVRSRPASRGAQTSLSTISEPVPRKNSVASTAFARRISTRMKHIRPPDEDNIKSKPSFRAQPAAPTDSAYSSGTDRKASIEKNVDEVETPRPPSRLGLFPKASEPLMPTAASMQGGDYSPRARTEPVSNTSIAKSAKSPVSSNVSKGRSLSIRNIFHRRQKSQLPT